MTTEPSNEVPGALLRQADTDTEIAETETRLDLIWDNEMPGLCVSVYGSGKKSFIFVYRRDNRQRFVRIGTTPRWSLEGARRWAKELRSAVDRGHDPELYNHERQNIKPVESFIQLMQRPEQSEARWIAVNIAKIAGAFAETLIAVFLVPLFLTLATVWILWHSLEKINPDEVTRHSGIRNHRVVSLVSNHRGGGCNRSESKGQKEPTYSVDLRFALRVVRLVQV